MALPHVPSTEPRKTAEIHLAMELGRELAPERIRVNAVSPGSILFPGGGWDDVRRNQPDRFAQFVERDLPAGRLGTGEEIADVVTFLLSDRANWISGAHICVDGAQGDRAHQPGNLPRPRLGGPGYCDVTSRAPS